MLLHVLSDSDFLVASSFSFSNQNNVEDVNFVESQSTINIPVLATYYGACMLNLRIKFW